MYTRLGLLGGQLNNINGLLGTTAPTPSSAWGSGGQAVTAWGTAVNNIEAQYRSADQNLIDGLYAVRETFRQAPSSTLSSLQQLAANTVVQMANADTPLTVVDLPHALALLIQQMTGVASVQASVPAAGAVTAVGTPTGTPAILVSVHDGTGRLTEYALPETLTFAVTADAQSGGATRGQEPLGVTGAAAQGLYGDTGVLDWDWPFGSGAGLSLNAVDATQDNQQGFGNYLVNGSFETFTNANLPDNWVSLGGAVGTNVFQGGVAYDGTKSLKFTGTGGTAAKVYQPFATASTTGLGTGGTPAALAPATQYAFSCWIQVTATPGAGVLEFALTDGADAVVQDMQAANQLVTKSLTAVSTSWVNVQGVLRTPAVLPAALRLRVRLSTDIDSGKSVYLDRLALTPTQALYAGGPQVAVFSGATALVNGLLPDTWTVAVTNTWGKFQQLFERFFGMTSLGLILPSSGSPTVSDALVT